MIKKSALFLILFLFQNLCNANGIAKSMNYEDIKEQEKSIQLWIENNEYALVEQLLNDMDVYWYSDNANAEYQFYYVAMLSDIIGNLESKLYRKALRISDEKNALILNLYERYFNKEWNSIHLNNMSTGYYQGVISALNHFISWSVENRIKYNFSTSYRENMTRVLVGIFKQIHHAKTTKLLTREEFNKIFISYINIPNQVCFYTVPMMPMPINAYKKELDHCIKNESERKHILNSYINTYSNYEDVKRSELAKSAVDINYNRFLLKGVKRYFSNFYKNAPDNIIEIKKLLLEAGFDNFFIKEVIDKTNENNEA